MPTLTPDDAYWHACANVPIPPDTPEAREVVYEELFDRYWVRFADGKTLYFKSDGTLTWDTLQERVAAEYLRAFEERP